ncbi:50S ribosomal protein L24 [Candidatus Woesearchaeota archaeon]|nr:50S ribosomal protein L24 [Candidatus Woesearchaeota archaeon]
MKSEFTNSWKRSRQTRKQRKYLANAPLHTKRKFISARLSKELTQKHKTRSMQLRKGDKVKIVVGNYKNHSGKIDLIETKYGRIYVEGTARTKTDGTKSLYPVHPSNVIIQELNLEDKKRKAILERKQK